MLSEYQLKMLTAELTKSAAREKQGRPYLPAAYVVNRLNQVFGFGRWRHSYTDLVKEERDGAVTCSCNVILSIWLGERHPATSAPDIVIEDVGVCSNKGRTYGDALNTALKGCISDGIKRCASYLGTQFQSPHEDGEAQRQDWRYWAEERAQMVVARRAGIAHPSEKQEVAEVSSPPSSFKEPIKVPGPDFGRSQASSKEPRRRASDRLHVLLDQVVKKHGLPYASWLRITHDAAYALGGVERSAPNNDTNWPKVPVRAINLVSEVLEQMGGFGEKMAAEARWEAFCKERRI